MSASVGPSCDKPTAIPLKADQLWLKLENCWKISSVFGNLPFDECGLGNDFVGGFGGVGVRNNYRMFAKASLVVVDRLRCG